MITVKGLLTSGVQTSADGKRFEPALPEPHPSLRIRLKDALAVLRGDAIAIRQTSIVEYADKPLRFVK